MNAIRPKMPLASELINRALPTENHQIQKYGFAILVTRPAIRGDCVPFDGEIKERVAFRAERIVITPNTTSATPPTTAINSEEPAGRKGIPAAIRITTTNSAMI